MKYQYTSSTPFRTQWRRLRLCTQLALAIRYGSRPAREIRFEQLIRDGFVADQAWIARLGHVSRARVTPIMKLLNLAPDIQEGLLCLPPVEQGRDAVTERELRAIVAEADWGKQRRMWEKIVGKR